jgi:hypothetical protein
LNSAIVSEVFHPHGIQAEYLNKADRLNLMLENEREYLRLRNAGSMEALLLRSHLDPYLELHLLRPSQEAHRRDSEVSAIYDEYRSIPDFNPWSEQGAYLRRCGHTYRAPDPVLSYDYPWTELPLQGEDVRMYYRLAKAI